jgi:hypothetical protein
MTYTYCPTHKRWDLCKKIAQERLAIYKDMWENGYFADLPDSTIKALADRKLKFLGAEQYKDTDHPNLDDEYDRLRYITSRHVNQGG